MGGLSAFSQLLAPASATGPGFLTNSAQTVGKTGAMTWQATAQAGAAETIAIWTVSDDTASSIKFVNESVTNSLFIPGIRSTQSTNQCGLYIEANITTDSAAVPAMIYQVTRAGIAAVATRPAFSWVNFATTLMTLSASGGLDITGGSAPGITLGASGTKITQAKVYSQTLTPASVAANTTAVQTFTVTGLTTADKVSLNHGAAQTAGIGIVGVRVSAADTLEITFANNTAGALTPVSSTCLILATRS